MASQVGGYPNLYLSLEPAWDLSTKCSCPGHHGLLLGLASDTKFQAPIEISCCCHILRDGQDKTRGETGGSKSAKFLR